MSSFTAASGIEFQVDAANRIHILVEDDHVEITKDELQEFLDWDASVEPPPGVTLEQALAFLECLTGHNQVMPGLYQPYSPYVMVHLSGRLGAGKVPLAGKFVRDYQEAGDDAGEMLALTSYMRACADVLEMQIAGVPRRKIVALRKPEA